MNAVAPTSWCIGVVLLTAVLIGCGSAGFRQSPGERSSGGSRAEGAPEEATDSLHAKRPDEAKPSEEGEGVPGYLVDPDGVAVSRDALGGRIKIKAAAGAVVAHDGSGAPVHVSAWQVEASDWRELLAFGQTPVAAKRLGSGVSAVDGSLDFEFDWNGTGLVILSTAAQAADGHILLGGSQAGRTATAVIESTDEGDRLVDIGKSAAGKPSKGKGKGKGKKAGHEPPRAGKAGADDAAGESDKNKGKSKNGATNAPAKA